MEPSTDLNPAAWCPLTPRGVAVFAKSSLGRVFLVQLVVALVAAGTTVWVLNTTWFPTVGAAIEHLPQQGQISSGRLQWPADSPQLLAENRFLAVAVDPNHAAEARSPAHLQVEFGQTDIRFYSLFGCLAVAYPKAYAVGLNYQELKPWWGAWAPILLALTAAGTAAGLLISWAILATLYCLAVWLLGLYLNRELTLWGSWRLAGAALMPAALVMIVALGLYGLGQLDVVRLIAAFILHFVVGWVYLVLGAMAAPRISSTVNSKTNPFTAAVQSGKESEAAAKPKIPNPFRPRGD